eukprot:scaffold166_cov106-Skeletonema_dohrnii-CCMP3373.AAC.8
MYSEVAELSPGAFKNFARLGFRGYEWMGSRVSELVDGIARKDYPPSRAALHRCAFHLHHHQHTSLLK